MPPANDKLVLSNYLPAVAGQRRDHGNPDLSRATGVKIG
jgi:hypothetical protein